MPSNKPTSLYVTKLNQENPKSQKGNEIPPRARELPIVDWKKTGLEKDLQIYGAGAKSHERPTLVAGRKPNGKSQASAKGTMKSAE
jgi:hypothetical protein